MAELDFERRLERLFADIPELPDAQGFTEGVERRLNRGWLARRWLIGVAGVVGGLIGASQLIMSNFLERMESASEGSAAVVSVSLNQIIPRLGWLAGAPSSAVVWAAVALAVVAMGFVVSRVLEEI
jgi:hypothetical protein